MPALEKNSTIMLSTVTERRRISTAAAAKELYLLELTVFIRECENNISHICESSIPECEHC